MLPKQIEQKDFPSNTIAICIKRALTDNGYTLPYYRGRCLDCRTNRMKNFIHNIGKELLNSNN